MAGPRAGSVGSAARAGGDRKWPLTGPQMPGTRTKRDINSFPKSVHMNMCNRPAEYEIPRHLMKETIPE